MPHLVIDCSESVLTLADPQNLIQAVYDATASTGLFELEGVAGIKVRLNPYKYYLNVDGRKDFVHVFANIMEGRNEDQKSQFSIAVVRKLKELLPSVGIISMNIRDFEKATYCNTLRLE